MQAQDIEAHLEDLGWELYNMGVSSPVRILMIGGAFMLTQMHSMRMTNDVDILLKDIEDPTTSPLYRVFKAAVRAVASRRQIPSTWVNDVIGDFLRDLGTVPNGVLWRTYAVLEVYVPEVEYILALKLLAGRQKDNRIFVCSVSGYLFRLATRHNSWSIDTFLKKPSKSIIWIRY